MAKTDEEIRQLAVDAEGGLVFTDRHINKNEDPGILGSVFMPLAFMDGGQKKSFQEDVASGKIGLIYEEMEKAMPRSINGYPIFMSMKYLSKDEADRFFEAIKQLREFVEGKKDE